LTAGRLEARDVYKGFIDPGLFPHHRAIADTIKKLEEDPNNAELKNDLGLLIARDGFWRDALRLFNEAADLDKKIATKAFFNAGLVSVWTGEFTSARSYFKKSTKSDPGNWPAWWMLGLTEERLGNVGAAVDAYKQSLRVDTSLFDTARNPYAPETRLKSRVLLETYQKRRSRGAQPYLEQLADENRVHAFLQGGKPTPVADASAETPRPEATPVPTAATPTSTPVPLKVSPPIPQAAPAPAPTPVPQRTKVPEVNPVDKGAEPPAPIPDAPPVAPPAPPAAGPGPGGAPIGFSDRPTSPYNSSGKDRPSGVPGPEHGGPGPGGSEPDPTPPPK
jgi:hypothetical protein